jgi:hypothetical protein
MTPLEVELQMIMAHDSVRPRETIAPAGQDADPASGRMLSGVLQATAVTVRIDPGIIAGWLPREVWFPEPRPNLYPLMILWGAQQDVCSFPGGGRWPLPWRLNYSEIITAVPGLRLAPHAGVSCAGPVTYLPRLYMNSWRAALLGRAVYGFRKAFARIEHSPRMFRAANRHGEHLLSATIDERRGGQSDAPPQARYADQPALFHEPVALDAAGRLMLARFEWGQSDVAVRSVSVDIDVRPRLLSYLPAIRQSFRGFDQERDGAFQFSAPWTLRRLA